ncbi:putative mitochondrial transporter UCP3 isoform X2 [Amphiura filiformis]
MQHLSKAKQRAQFKYQGVFGTIATITRQEGAKSLYNGLVPGLQRQMCFCAVRIGCYDTVSQIYTEKAKRNGYHGPAIFIKIAAGITTGALAVTCAQPTDVVKVRMQAQVNVGAVGAIRYNGALDAYRSIAKFEGVAGLWKGIMPNISRNAIVNASELVAYGMIKERILRSGYMRDLFPLHVVSAFGAGFVTTCVASPVDVVKTRYMNSKSGQYKSAIDCAMKMFKEGGPVAFYKGFTPNFIRLGAWNIVMFVTFEQLKRVAVMATRQVQ